MTRILLVDDSPHAQRMGERILSEEGYEVVTVSNADSALIRLEDVDPDIVIADTVMPGRTGFDICQFVKLSPRHRHTRVILTAGVLETLDEAGAKRVEADGVLKKPFEATVLIAAVKPLAEAAVKDRVERTPEASSKPAAEQSEAPLAPFITVVDEEQVRAAVTVALDASMASMVDEIARRVVATLMARKPDVSLQPSAAAPPPAPVAPEPAKPAPPEPVIPPVEPVRRVTPIRMRGSSILGLDVGSPDPES
jgi:CheY-like chemotaxis protein